jgi:D-glycero-alpha-D-manno-heptose-7-phosphate kinase
VAVKTNMRRPLLVLISWSFYKDDKVIVNPLRVKHKYAAELEHNLVLFYTGNSRESAKIIENQSSNVTGNKTTVIEAM